MLETGWLSPTGEFFSCDICEHIKVGYKIMDQIAPNETVFPDIYLMANGWVHITKTTELSCSLYIFWDCHLTPEQKQFLTPYFEDESRINKTCYLEWEAEINGYDD